MSCINNFGDINETFIIEPLVLDDTFVTGFTLSSNNIILTQNRIDQYSAFTITLSGLTGSSLNVYVTGGTYDNNTGTATFVNSTGGTFQVTGFTTGTTSTASGDYLSLSGGTVTGNTIFTSGLTANIISATTISGGTFYGDGSQLTGIVASAVFTGGTVSGATNFISGLTADTISATTYFNLPKDIFVTGGTYSADASTLIFTNNSGGTFNVSGITTSTQFTGGTVSGATNFISGLTADTISATTYLNLPVTADTFVTGFTLSSNTITLTQNRIDQYSAFTISLSAYTGSSSTSGAYLPLSGGTVSGATSFISGLTADTISATTYLNLPVTADTFVTGFTLSSNTITLTQNTTGQFSAFTISLSAYTGGSTTVTGNFLPLSGGTVSGNTIFTSGLTANTLNVTGNTRLAAVTANTLNVTGSTRLDGVTADTLTVTGSTRLASVTANTLTITGNTLLAGLTATTISATTYLNLPVTADTFVTGFTLSSNTITLRQNTTGQFSAFTISLSAYTGSSSTSGAYLPLSGGTVSGATSFISGLTANTISATTYQNLPNTLYTGNGVLSGDRIVGLSSYTLNFSSSTSANNLVLSGGSVGVGTATPSASALFELSSTTKGFLGPRMTEAQRLAISSPVTGLIVYQTNADEGYFLYKSFGWVQIM